MEVSKKSFCLQKWWNKIFIIFHSKRSRFQKDIFQREISGKPLKVSKPSKWECWDCWNNNH